MSYDLMVFAPEAAPAKRAAFLDWYDAQTEWDEEHGYDDLASTTPGLQAFYRDMVESFPPLALDEENDETEDAGTDYTIASSLIYMSFPWNKVDEAYEAVYRLAAKYELGFFDVSSDIAETWLPDRKGGLRVAHSD
jgi:hypothetical protein